MVLLIRFPKGVNFIHIDCVIDLPPPPLHSNQILPSRGQTCPGAWGKHLSKVSHLALSSKLCLKSCFPSHLHNLWCKMVEQIKKSIGRSISTTTISSLEFYIYTLPVQCLLCNLYFVLSRETGDSKNDILAIKMVSFIFEWYMLQPLML